MKVPLTSPYTDKDHYYMNDILAENLDQLKKAVEKNWDGVFMVDGIEGSAKTTFGSTICKYLDPNFNLDNVVFLQDDFFTAVDQAKPGTAILWDEFIFGGLSTEALNKIQNSLIKKMTTIRKKQLYICLVMPWFFMMRPYFAIGRTRFLINCYTPDGISRGRFRFYDYNKKRLLYLFNKKEYNYGRTTPNFNGQFTNTMGYLWNNDEYDTKKEEAIIKLTDDTVETKRDTKLKDKYMGLLVQLYLYMNEKYNFSLNDLTYLTGYPHGEMRKHIKKFQDNQNKVLKMEEMIADLERLKLNPKS